MMQLKSHEIIDGNKYRRSFRYTYVYTHLHQNSANTFSTVIIQVFSDGEISRRKFSQSHKEQQ